LSAAWPDGRLDIAVMCDSVDEQWPSMDLVGDMLLEQWQSDPTLPVRATRVSMTIPPIARRLPWAPRKAAFNADRALARYLGYPLRALTLRRPGRFFHVVDHSYGQLVHALPGDRTGIYCHDLDAFRPILFPNVSSPERKRHSGYRMSLARILLGGLRSAALVFHSTREVGRALEQSGFVDRSRLVLAPYGVGPEFRDEAASSCVATEVLGPLAGRPFVLHVGTGIPRKRLDVLFEVFARVHAVRPELRLVQQGASLSPEQRAHVERLGIGPFLLQPPRLDRATLADLYRRAALVLVPSDSEGFGLPVIEALACGAPVVASDLAVLREVGEDAAIYAPVGDVSAWSSLVAALVGGQRQAPPRELRLARGRSFTWRAHARTLLDAYDRLRRTEGGPPIGG
jgi:glycosyltransferase involved in cell wall biosynthesis